MILQIKENIKLGRVLNKKHLNMLSDVLSSIQNDTEVEVVAFDGLYEAISSIEATKALDAAIQGHDVFVTKEEYEKMINELSDDIYNQEQGFNELTCVANDMAEDILKKYNKA